MNQELIEQNQTKHQHLVHRASRLVPIDFIAVVDSMTDEKIGSVMNFNQEGMQLMIYKEDMELNDILELTLVSKSAQSKLQYINVIAELLWMKNDEIEDRVLGGFYLNTQNLKSKFRLNQLIKSLS